MRATSVKTKAVLMPWVYLTVPYSEYVSLGQSIRITGLGIERNAYRGPSSLIRHLGCSVNAGNKKHQRFKLKDHSNYVSLAGQGTTMSMGTHETIVSPTSHGVRLL